MKKENFRWLWAAVAAFLAFGVWTYLLGIIDVQAIGPRGSAVGFAAINKPFHNLTGVNMVLYSITDWLGLVPVAFGFGFAALGLCQWIKRRNILKVDFSLLMLGAFYIAVLAAYLFFESNVVNYRPVLIEGFLEASYPSSTTMLALCIMPTSAMQLSGRIKKGPFHRAITLLIYAFTAFMVVGRLISGVHWLSDIVGGVLLSSGLVMLYRFAVGIKKI